MAHCKWLASLVLTATIVPALAAETHCPGNVASVPLRYVNRYQMIVSVSVDHSGPYDFLLDTGAQVTIVDPTLSAELRLSADGSAAITGMVGFHESASMANLDVLAVGAHAVFGSRAVVYDLTRMKAGDLHISGILGEDFLQHFDMLIDNAHGVLCLDETNTIRTSMKGQQIPLLPPSEATEGAPAAKPLVMSVRFFNGMRPVRLKLDSGSNASLLYGPSEYLALGAIEGPSWRGRGANGDQQAFVALPPQDMRISGVALSGVSFLTLRNERKSSHTAAYDGLLPTGLFRRVFVSHSGEFAVLEPRF